MKTSGKNLLVFALPTLLISGCGSDSEQLTIPTLETKTLNLLTVNGLTFKDHNKNGELDAYEDWRLSPKQRAENLTQQMNNAEKAGLMMHGTFVLSSDSSRLVFKGDGITNTTLIQERFLNTFITRQEGDATLMAEDNNHAQELAEHTRLGIPVSISTDPRNHFNAALGTSVSSGDFSQWSETLGLAAIGDAEFTKTFADVIRQEYLAVGINQALHPTADLATEPRWGRVNSTFGENAELSREMTKAYVQGLQHNNTELTKDGVWAVVKHFAGGGPQENGADAHYFAGRYQVYPGNNFDYHRIPFKGAFEAGVAGVMPYYGIPYEQLPESEGNVGFGYSKYIMTDILRGEENFDGVLLSDWLVANDCVDTCRTGIITHEDAEKNPFTYLGMPWGKEDEDSTERFAASVDAGIDQFGGIDDPALLLANIESGRLTQERIDLSVNRILTNKFKQGLFEDPFVDVAKVNDVVGKTEFQELGIESQGRSVTLLKNDNNALPLSVEELGKVYVYANYGGTEQPSIVDNAQQYGLNVAENMADADTIIIRTQTPATLATAWFPFGVAMPSGELGFVAQEDFQLRPYETQPDREPGESAQLCYEGLTDNLGACIYNSGNVYSVINQAINSGKRVIFDVFMIRPAALGNINDQLPIILANFGTSDSVFFDVITGKVKPEGKLPFGLPKSTDEVVAKGKEDVPSYEEDPSITLYPFGYGLSY
ncbi:glycoside hydrolase family 3 C-terminal domain-containing protein [Vibrio sp. B172a]|uniref:glycoside hydrolase family 3 protein n=1 Tax=Vibrio sp. B172a TaxID=2835790 RepID=UPI0025548B54|nr:glycoside hydrolase family 3 N-terminal domain-containing protein [Vibrio sp. B172a]MDK9781678.1 glycoside hydrolase family 3 C-terminal domain-containing protein [Vibrio sp. B172a]